MNDREGKKPVGRPRGFCPEEALDRAIDLFWRKGYEGTTLPELTAAMGINRPSLYAAFGNKESLFRRAVDRYLATHNHALAEAIALPTAREAAEASLRRIVGRPADTPPGCLVVQAALVCGDAADPIRRELACRRSLVELALRSRFERAVAEGELASDAQAADLARYITTVGEGLVVRSLSGAHEDELNRVVDTAMCAWPSNLSP